MFIFALMYLLVSGGFVSESLMLLMQSAFKTTERPCKGNEVTYQIQVKLRGKDSFSFPGKRLLSNCPRGTLHSYTRATVVIINIYL